ncbi:hypothetical protein [Paenibacillus ihbetae]|uniref:Uncharacterized protein n=1 Tax=Paenibacillus ihbetae TaxID=1870820 RepID=A0ABX3K3J4_9BACL|nr:hypothetical protein [Paenibacillus ihbetae]OOC64005.1 hypothetical protein BBD40_20360 [Paenibacillus ihbetae]
MTLSEIQQEALEQAKKHGRLVRWKKGGYWTYEGVLTKGAGSDSSSVPNLEWYCRTNTIFALVRRGYITMDNWSSCSLVQKND